MKRRILVSFLFSILIMPMAANASRVTFNAELGTPVVRANQIQKTYMKISLTGFEIQRQQRTPVNIALVLDQSGSMSGEKIARARDAAMMVVDFLEPDDIVSVVTYDDTVNVVVPATRISDKQMIKNRIRSIRSGGSTALFAGVVKGADEVRKFFSRQRVNRVILLSDGLANVGPSSTQELGELGMSLGRDAISVTTIGLGLGYNEDLMTQLASYSDGNHAFVENAYDLNRVFESEFGDVLSVVAQEVYVEIHCAPGIRPVRVLGRDAKIVGQTIYTRLNQLYSKQEKYFLVEVEVPAGIEGRTKDVASVDVSYLNLKTQQKDKMQRSVAVSYSDSEEKVKGAQREEVMEKAVIQVANETSKQAVKLRDEGKVQQAKQLLESNAEFLSRGASDYDSQALKDLEQQTLEDAEKLDDAKEWNRTRKSLKSRQYKLKTQQSY